MFYEAAAAGLMSVGCGVYFLSINPTPTVGLITRKIQAAGAVQITASHNPAEYNGLKLFADNGAILGAEEGRNVLRLYQDGTARLKQWHDVGKAQTVMLDPSREHTREIMAHVDCNAIAKRRFRILVDANHGAGGPLALIVGSVLGCHVVRVGCEPDGCFAHLPEPTEANVSDVAKLVVAERCDLGAVLDPDADRLALIDEQGRYIGEELTLGLAAAYRLKQAQGPVVVNMSTSRLVEDLAAQYGCPFYRSAVGEANVVAKMLEVRAVLGGEGNGGVIDPRVGLVRDPFIGLALVLSHLAETGEKLSEAVAKLPRYHIVKTKQEVEPARLRQVYEMLTNKWPKARANYEDGLRLDWEDRWVHVRPSNTEPIVRVIAEGPEADVAIDLCRHVGAMVGQLTRRSAQVAVSNRRARSRASGKAKASTTAKRKKEKRQRRT
jgi:phosphomannomutase